jgi:hypothetical protein
MSVGCFSWCPPLRRLGAKKQTTEAKLEVRIDSSCVISLTQIQEHPLAIVQHAAPVPVAKIFTEPESDEVNGLNQCPMGSDESFIQKLFENTLEVVPTKTQYIMASGKQALALLQTAASVIPVPLLQDAIGVAMKIIEVCEVCGNLHRVRKQFTHISIRMHQLSK